MTDFKEILEKYSPELNYRRDRMDKICDDIKICQQILSRAICTDECVFNFIWSDYPGHKHITRMRWDVKGQRIVLLEPDNTEKHLLASKITDRCYAHKHLAEFLECHLDKIRTERLGE